jgi:hypothetical protein
MARLRITETITLISFVPVDKDHYPAADEGQGAMTPEEAREYELDRDVDDLAGQWIDMLQDADFGEGDPETMDQRTTGSASMVVEIVE